MRLWSLHPKYLDPQGLVAVWREGLLAKKVLEEKTKGYKNHPQLIRFRQHPQPLKAISYYLWEVFGEAKKRGYRFNRRKIGQISLKIEKINITLGQFQYELKHLKNKLKDRNKAFYQRIRFLKKIKPHPLFKVIKGGIASWEVIKK